ncbi:MAG: TIGR04282 family arsenosugar biosynthesis glycosyltransferase [Mariprofundaceae bacterium]|nr:TIGR04282 family arsenosugar biosynthesis glycosyltransferase [Mariprofundaceae bacterium]
MNEVADNRLHVIIMCKAPVTGRVKTRLTPPYSADEAAAIYRAMAETVIKRTSGMFPDVRIASDDISHPFFRQFELNMIDQGEGDLGDRMTRLMQQAFNDGAGSVLFLGTDSPHMPESRLVEAAERLNDYDVVVGPVEDGGYDLIGMNRPCPELFENIPWSTELVLQQTVQQAEVASISLTLLDMGYDLDGPESLRRAAPIWNAPVSLPEKYQKN